ncbi:RNA helicase [Vulcanimicrobium alpinum]|uniref:RNA helicase n=1 Tax=Vulcanimicrobium alpinum TaxID=3016050 RepID=A0AAN1XVW1_UNVUL|nr:DEAD/DEAH box helicase [Vulcanimicrobium alpinum]BDE05183.1 RNA helicase [Vulcanimicrobium alpinum]
MQTTFDDLGLAPGLLRAVRELGFTTPTPVQAGAIPPALAGRDVLASAQTGTGKTAAFGLPLLQMVSALPRKRTHGLILAPTRELAAQIAAHLTELAKGSGLRVRAIFGGIGYAPQMHAIRTGTEILVATPGRLIDHLDQGARLDDVSLLVLDEADRMLDMGFLPAVRRIVAKAPARKQTLFFSATIAPEIAKLSRELLRDPVRIEIASKSAEVTAEGITHVAYTIDQQRKTDLLVELLKDNNIFSAIAFTRTKARANRLAMALEKHGIGADRIHGDRSQAQRTRALADFKRGKLRVLVATDVAARGIDIADLGHVVNFDVPMVAEDYVHRVGRTARAEATGDAITFVAHDEEKLFRDIEKVVGRRIDRAKLPELPPAKAPLAAPQQHPSFAVPRRGDPVHHAPRARNAPARPRTAPR